jgi:N6-L-threonylcarbamoyladenine synthase/protein kinase Bud32
MSPGPAAVLATGAEAVIETCTFLGRPALRKRRVPKAYRDARLDATLRDARTRDEAHLLAAARRAGVHVPLVLDVDRRAAALVLEHVPGPTLAEQLDADLPAAARHRMAALGVQVAALHGAGLTHGDLTTRNVIVPRPEDPAHVVLVDFGLGAFTDLSEARGVDLHLVEEALAATQADAEALVEAFLASYAQAAAGHEGAFERLGQIRRRGRYR